MLDKELASQLTDDEKQDIKYRYFELLPKVLAHPEILYEGSIEGTSEELINTLAKIVISLKSEEKQEKTSEVVANIIVDAVPEDELIKIIKEAVDRDRKKNSKESAFDYEEDREEADKIARRYDANRYTL